MSSPSITRLLLVEDSAGDARLLREMLDEHGAPSPDVTWVECMSDAEKHLAAHAVEIMFLDLGLPDSEGLDAVRRAHAAAPHIPLVVLTSADDESLAINALQAGAQDYLIKGQIDTRGLRRALRYAIERKNLEQRYRNLMEHANDAILVIEPPRILEANRRAEELLGCAREEIVGRSYDSFIAPEDRGQLAADRASLLAKGATWVQDQRLVRKDGAVVFADVSSSIIQLGDDTVVLSILHDTRERKRAEHELGAARNLLHHVVSESPAVIFALRIDGNNLTHLAWISENIERLAGYTVEEALVPEWWMDHLHPDERGTVLEDLAGLFVHGRLIQEYRFRHRDGAYRWFRDEKRILPAGAGAPSEAVGSWSDVTVRKTAELRLLESEGEYRLVFDTSPHPMWVYDVESLAFLAVNEAAIRLYGFSRDEFLGMATDGIRGPELPARSAHVGRMPEPPAGRASQWTHRKKDGSILEVAGVSSPIEFHGKRARLVLAIDVTDNKALEAQLLQAQKMEVVGRLAGGVAHDFNNLLAVIMGYSELLLSSFGPQHPGSRRIEQIRKAAERAAGLTRQLLAFSRKQALPPRVLDLNEVVADVGKMLHRVIGEDIRLETRLGAGLGRVRADPGHVEQVLMNLVVNARDAMPKGGGLILETANIALDESYARAHPEVKPGQFVMLSVSDTGEGMDARTRAHIFEPFFTTKEEGKGTGLGLATVLAIVQRSGGSISVHSRVGMGTTCKVYLPRVQDDLSRPVQAVPGAALPRGTETILLVEDADSVRVVIREILEGAGYTVIESADPEEALLRVSALDAPVHLMLTDVVMPRMSGPELARSIRIARPEIKVLFMSGYGDDALGLHGVRGMSSDTGAMGRDGRGGAGTRFIQKPFTADALGRRIREALDEA